MNKTLRVVCLLLAVLLGGCIKQSSSSSASHQLAATQLGSVAVLPFNGDFGTVFSDRIAYELLRNGTTVLTKPATIRRLDKAGLSYVQAGTAEADILKLGKQLDVDVLVFGSVYAVAGKASLLETAQGDLSLRASSASIRLVSAKDGRVLSTANYKQGDTLGLFKSTYKDVAEQLVNAVLTRQ